MSADRRSAGVEVKCVCVQLEYLSNCGRMQSLT